MLTTRKILALAMTERSILAAELRLAGRRREIERAAEFDFPEGVSLQEPGRLGSALGQFLRQRRFSAKRTIVGIPAKWLMAKEMILPPAGAESTVGILRIQAEREFSSNIRDLALDYVGRQDSRVGRSVLLVATSRQRINQVLAMAQAARLSVQSVTSSTMALASVVGEHRSAGELTLCLSPDSAELVAQSDRGFHLLRHLSEGTRQSGSKSKAADSWVAALAGEVHRAVSLLSDGRASKPPDTLYIWDGGGVSATVIRALGERLSLGMKVCEPSSVLGIAGTSSADGLERGRFAAAAALALGGVQPRLLAIDFLHPRLAAKKKIVFGKRKALWAAAVGATVLIACVFLVLDQHNVKEEVAALRSRLQAMNKDIEAASGMVEKVSFARGWYDGRPRHLECLRELTLAFPSEGRIWTTSMHVKGDMRGLVSGKSVDERTVLDVLDRLKRSGMFRDVQLLYIRQAGRSVREVSFAVSFNFVGGG